MLELQIVKWKKKQKKLSNSFTRIQDHSSIFTAEARAILLALECIEHSNRKRFLIFSDSMSCLQALDHLKIDHPIIEEIISKLTSLKASGFDIHLCWLPGHVGIRGYEHANRAVKTARRTAVQHCTDFYEFFECFTSMSFFFPPSHDCLKQ